VHYYSRSSWPSWPELGKKGRKRKSGHFGGRGREGGGWLGWGLMQGHTWVPTNNCSCYFVPIRQTEQPHLSGGDFLIQEHVYVLYIPTVGIMFHFHPSPFILHIFRTYVSVYLFHSSHSLSPSLPLSFSLSPSPSLLLPLSLSLMLSCASLSAAMLPQAPHSSTGILH